MSEAAVVSAPELIGGNPPEKKQRPPWPPGEPLKETFPGSKMYRHPVDKAYIKPADAIALGAPEPTAATPQPAPAPAPEPAPQPQPAPQPEPSQAAPDFSDLPPSDSGPAPGGDQQEQQPSEADLLSAYQQMGAMFWDSIIRLMAALFGDCWLPKTADERKMVLDALTGWMKSVAFAAFTPLQNLWMAVGLYAMPRVPQTVQKLVAWWKSRKKKPAEPERKNPRAEGQPHNYAGVNVTDIEAEVTRGPGI